MRGVAALRDQGRQPPDLQLQPHDHQQIRLPQFEQEAGLGFHEVRILVALGHRFDVDLVAAHFLRQSRQVGRRRYDIQLLGRRNRRGKQAGCHHGCDCQQTSCA